MGTYPLPVGTPLAGGTIVGYTDTAYRVELGALGLSSTFVPYVVAHPTTPATPLVVFA